MTATKRTTAGVATGAAVVLLIGVAAFGIGRYGGFAPGLPGATATVADGAGADRMRAAGARADKLAWRALTPAQQAALLPLQAEWDRMDGARKAKWLELAKRFTAMKPEEQQRVHERMRAWVRLTPEQRELARETYMRTRKIAPEQKNASWKNYQELPDEQKRQLAASTVRKPAPDSDKSVPAPVRNVAACPAGTVKNTLSATPPCVAAPLPVTPPAPPAQPAPPPVAPPPPAPQEKPVPANWGITPNNA